VNSPADHVVMLKVRDGDVAKLGLLFERYQGVLFNFFLRLTGNRQISEDLVQDVFFRMLKYRHTYLDESDFTTWMYQIARNVRFDYFRKRKREVMLNEEENERVSPGPGQGEKLERDQQVVLLRGALARLPEEKREILLLSRFQNLKYDQIARILCCDVGTVKVRVYRAVRELGEIFFRLSGERVS
jgi:RNA polymerase sigma factor (sigma-70 family)